MGGKAKALKLNYDELLILKAAALGKQLRSLPKYTEECLQNLSELGYLKLIPSGNFSRCICKEISPPEIMNYEITPEGRLLIEYKSMCSKKRRK